MLCLFPVHSNASFGERCRYTLQNICMSSAPGEDGGVGSQDARALFGGRGAPRLLTGIPTVNREAFGRTWASPKLR